MPDESKPVEIDPPFYPLIYIRGYAGNDDEIEETVATPFMGFDAGSTKLRQLWTGEVRRHYFESPLVRLMKDYDYRDVYSGGSEMPMDFSVRPRSIFIYRYYDQMSKQLGPGRHSTIENFATGLSDLILTIRDRICGADEKARAAFKIHLVAHSMGGLICRCFLQNPKCGRDEARKLVDKVFTYATPHNGIEMEIVGNIPSFFSMNDINNFNRDRMREYLALRDANLPDEDVSSLNGKFDPDRFFCLVGTNDRDYTAAKGLSRRFVGPMSDGLVRIANAAVWGPGADGRPIQAPRAYVYRSHSGHYGIVNSEEGYQNLIRFLFGDVRVDGRLEIDDVSLPQDIEDARLAGKEIRASYHIDCVVRVRGAMWDLHRRVTAEESAIFRTYQEIAGEKNDPATARHPILFSAFLSSAARVNDKRPSLGFCVDLAIRVPQYEVDRKFWFDDHYEGGHIFRDKINLEAFPPTADATDPTVEASVWTLKYGFDSTGPNAASQVAAQSETDDGISFVIPVAQPVRPGLKARLVLRAKKLR